MSARARLTISFTALFGALVIALAIGAYALIRNDTYLKLDAVLQAATGATAMSAEHELNEHSKKTDGEKDLRSVLDESGSPALADTQILVREGNRTVAYKPGVRHEFDLRSVPPHALLAGATISGFRIAAQPLQSRKFETLYQIYSAKPIAPALVQLRLLRVALFIFVPIGLALAGVAGYLLARRSLRPLAELAQIVDTVTSSELSARVKVRNEQDEIGTLAVRFNSLLDRLEEAFTLQRRFMADASHQIRTPMTVALAAAQVTSRDSSASLRDCTESLQIVEHQMLQLRRTVEDMFFLSQTDTGSLQLDRKEMYLDDAVSEAVRAAKALSGCKQQAIRVESLAEAKCLGDADLFKQAVLILLDNAIKFTPPGGSIDIVLLRRGVQWICSVTDTGIGISEAAQSRIFERFFRESRPGKEGSAGAGLGLAIAKSIVENHGGTLSLIDSRPGRTTFEIAIPVLEEASSDRGYANSFAVRM